MNNGKLSYPPPLDSWNAYNSPSNIYNLDPDQYEPPRPSRKPPACTYLLYLPSVLDEISPHLQEVRHMIEVIPYQVSDPSPQADGIV